MEIVNLNTGSRIVECRIERVKKLIYAFPIRDLGAAYRATPRPKIQWFSKGQYALVLNDNSMKFRADNATLFLEVTK